MNTYELEERMFINRFCNIYDNMTPEERNIVRTSYKSTSKDVGKSEEYHRALSVYKRVYKKVKSFKEIALEMSETYNENITEYKAKYYYDNGMRKIVSFLNRNKHIEEELKNYLLFID